MFYRTRTFKKKNGRTYTYRYSEVRYRKGKKVKSISRIVGAVGAFIRRQQTHGVTLDWDKIEKIMLARQKQERIEKQIIENKLYAKYGLRVGPDSPKIAEEKAPRSDAGQIGRSEPQEVDKFSGAS